MIRQRHRHHEEERRGDRAEGDDEGAPPALAQPRARHDVPQRPHHRQHGHGDERPAGEQHADDEETAGDEQRDDHRHQNPIGGRGKAVEHEPGLLRAARDRPLGLAHAERVALREIRPVAQRARREIGHLDQVAEDVIGVVAQQRVAVEDQRRDAGDHHDVEEQRLHAPRLDREPDIEGERGDEHLHRHAGGADQRAAVLGAECGSGRCFHVGHGHQHEKDQAHVVHFAAARLGGGRVAELVERLDHRE